MNNAGNELLKLHISTRSAKQALGGSANAHSDWQTVTRNSLRSLLGIVPDLHPCSVIASVSVSEPKQSILFLDKNGLLLTANRRSRNDPRRRLRIVIPADAGIQ